MKLWAILPELVVAGACLGLVPLAGLVRHKAPRLPGWIALGALLLALALTLRMFGWAPESVFQGRYAVDGLGHLFKAVVLVGAAITQAMLLPYFGRREPGVHAPVALLFATLGALTLISSTDLGLIVLFLQMMSMAGYVLAVVVRGSPRAMEAAIKYLIYGGVALAVMAYGLTFLYGLTGNLQLAGIGRALASADRPWVALAVSLVLVGYGFEIAVVPFHPWLPDVVEGATAPVGGFVTVVPKIAALGALLRFLLLALPGEQVAWPAVLAVASAVTMTFGNALAVRQTRLKRMLAWSSVAQAGYLLMGVAAASRAPGAVGAVAWYAVAYALMNLGGFAVAGVLERALGTTDYRALAGLGRRSPWLVGALTVALLSLAGFPPFAGFAGKVFLLQPVLEAGFGWLAAVAVLNFLVGLYVYVRPLAASWLEAEGPVSRSVPMGAGWGTVALGAALVTTLLGAWPGPALEYARALSTLLR